MSKHSSLAERGRHLGAPVPHGFVDANRITWPMRRQWTINGRFLAQPLTGVQRYALETVRALEGLIAGQAELARGLEGELVLRPDAVHSPGLRAIGTRTVGRYRGHAAGHTALPGAVAGGLL